MRDEDRRHRSLAFARTEGPPESISTSVLMQVVEPATASPLRGRHAWSRANYIESKSRCRTLPVDSSQHLVTFATPTAVFAWPRLLPASQMGPDPPPLMRYDRTYAGPVSHQNYADAKSMLRWPSNSSGQGRRAGESTQGIDYGFHEINPCYTRSTSGLVQHSLGMENLPLFCSTVEQVVAPPTRAYAELPNTWTPSQIASETIHASSRTSTQLRGSAPSITSSIAWEKYSKRVQSKGGNATYVCLWNVRHGKCETACKYTSKKQLVKRHILTTHLKYKPYVCATCPRRFPQKADLDIHTSSHSGILPHICNYGCGKAFKDPARRHRHHVDVHGYVPKKYKKYRVLIAPNDDDGEDEDSNENKAET